MSQIPSKLLIIAAAVVLSGAALALSTDSGQPINIEADRAEADNARRVTIYRGDVIITQGTLKITGETVTIYYDEQSRLTKLVSVGKPARFRQLPDGQSNIPKNYQKARAKRMEYYARKDLIVLLGSAVFDQGGDRVAAERIVYDSKNSRMQAESRTASKSTGSEEKKPRSRVRIKIEPKKSN